MKKADIFKKGWKFTVITSLIKEEDDYWLYDIKCAYLKYWSSFPEVIGYEDLQDEFETQYWFIKVKKISWNEEEDWEQIIKHFEKNFKEQEIQFIRF